jgi:hypothetical protein
MTTRFIGIKEFRQTISQLAASSRRGKERFILMRNQEPIFEIRPLSKSDATLEALSERLRASEKQIKAGGYLTQAQMEKKIGL